MRDALNSTGRPIFYSICNWGFESTANWAPEVGNSWRTTGDIRDSYESMMNNFFFNDKDIVAASPGGWNDPDMLEVGNGNMTHDEEKTHFTLWTFAKAPLILGADLTKISQDSLTVISNTDLIEINQNPNLPQAHCVVGCGTGKVQVFVTKQPNVQESYAAVINTANDTVHNFFF